MRAARIIRQPYLFATVMALPLVVFLLLLCTPAKPPPVPPLYLLDRLKEHGLLDYADQHAAAVGKVYIRNCLHYMQMKPRSTMLLHETRYTQETNSITQARYVTFETTVHASSLTAYTSTFPAWGWHADPAGNFSNQQQTTQAAAFAPGARWPSKQQIAAAAQYYKEAVAGAKQRPAAPAAKYVIPPEPPDMRAQYKKVSSSGCILAHGALYVSAEEQAAAAGHQRCSQQNNSATMQLLLCYAMCWGLHSSVGTCTILLPASCGASQWPGSLSQLPLGRTWPCSPLPYSTIQTCAVLYASAGPDDRLILTRVQAIVGTGQPGPLQIILLKY